MIEARHQVRMSLVNCAICIRERDPLIRRALQLGIPATEIARILSLSRRQVTRIASLKPGGPQSASEAEGTAQHLKDDAS